MTTLRVNGIEREVATHPRAALLWALRDELGCASAKYGCGAEQCGACRVLIDGAPASSCAVTVGRRRRSRRHDARGARRATGGRRPVVDAMLAVDAGQCGYCLPGIVTTLTALGERSAARTDAGTTSCGPSTTTCAAAARTAASSPPPAPALGVADE